MKIVGVTGENAIAELHRLQNEFAQSGLWPILIGDDKDLELIQESLEDSSESPADILVASDSLIAENCFCERMSRYPNLHKCEDGEWPNTAPGEIGIITHLNLSGSRPKKKVSIALLQIDNS